MTNFSKMIDDLMNASDESWRQVHSSSLTNSTWASKEYWNIKFFKNNPPNDPDAKQEDFHGNWELPYKRNIFYPRSTGRFYMNHKPIAYVACDWTTASCETIKKFREQCGLSWKDDFEPYIDGLTTPNPEAYGYPITYKLSKEAGILDLCIPDHFIDSFSLDRAIFQDFMQSRDESVYECSSQLAEIALSHNFDGIAFKSVRVPIDINLPDTNLVLFNQNVIKNSINY
jgi:hypothetical protein